jgi:LPS export ABC transporter protein LptC
LLQDGDLKARLQEEVLKSMPAGLQFSLERFQRSETKDGVKVWEVVAARGSYNPSQSVATVEEADLMVFRKEGVKVKLLSPKAALQLEGAKLKGAILEGGITLYYTSPSGYFEMKTAGAEYDAIAETLHTGVAGNQGVVITGEKFKVTGGVLRVNLANNAFELSDGVKSVFQQ